jgi:hypothetical protein
MRRNLPGYISGTVLGAIAGAVTGIAATAFGWLITLGALAALAAAFAAVQALRRANRQHAQIIREEVDGPRALEAERRELTDPDPFAMEQRVERREENP